MLSYQRYPKTVGRFCDKFIAYRGNANKLLLLRLFLPVLSVFGGQVFILSEVKQMPNAKVLEAKQAAVAALSAKIADSVAGVIVDYSGTSVADDTVLRKELREAGIDYSVVKNTLLGRAIEGTDLEEIKGVLEGTTAIAISKDDHTAAARILKKFADAHENFKIKAGYLDGKAISVETVDSLAKLPTRDVLLATVLGAFQAPMASFARAVQAIVDKNGEGEAVAE